MKLNPMVIYGNQNHGKDVTFTELALELAQPSLCQLRVLQM